MKIVTPEQMRYIDRTAIEDYGIAGALLMENAGRALAEALCALDDIFVCDHAVMIFCGQGNNGGDGFVAARHLFVKGFSVKIVFAGTPEKLSPESQLNYVICRNMGILVSDDYTDISQYPFIIDALLGTGIDRDVTGKYRSMIEAINNTDSFVVSADIPSGVHGEYGHIMGCAVQADVTVSFGLFKIGMLLYPGFQQCGKIVCADISVPPQIYEHVSSLYAVHKEYAAALFPKRRVDCHKGQCGKIAVFAGSPGMGGAAVLCAMGALRTGAGLVYSVIYDSAASELSQVTESVKIKTADDGSSDITDILKKTDCVAAGPGWSQGDASERLLKKILAFDEPRKIVLDADALNIVSKNPEILKNTVHHIIITPHAGEMARLCRLSTDQLLQYPVRYAVEFAQNFNVTVVLKSARTIIAAPDGAVYINMSGNPFMATGGMGDVLTGFIASFAAQGCAPDKAAVLGTFLHGFTGDLCAGQKNLSLLPTDIIESAGTGIAVMLGAES